MSNPPILKVENLRKVFGGRGGLLKKADEKVAVNDVSFEVREGETLALVGESGSGKSTVGLMALGLLSVTSGKVLFDGRSVTDLNSQDRLALRRKIQVVFQDPYGSLNGRMTVRETLTEGMVIHKLGANTAEREERAKSLLLSVGMLPEALDRYPHEFSGGMRQRVVIAIAMANDPDVILADEPTTALDVTVQAEILRLLRELVDERHSHCAARGARDHVH